jgi:hypothetical protein
MTGDRRIGLNSGSLHRGEIAERLYELLPAYLRFRDQSEPLDSPLRALMAVLERQHAVLERDIQGLYDDWFIETCQDWIAPYLGDLLGVRGLDRPEAWVPGQRTRIANAISYRRLKGTTAVLERVARDVTGWPCVASPFFDRLSSSQSLEHLRPQHGRTVDLRDRAALTRFGGPFDPLARRPQISGAVGLAPAEGPREGYNLPNIGLYFWRLQSYPVARRTARWVATGCYTFHPLGIDQPLLTAVESAGDLPARATQRQVPGLLTRARLAEELAARRDGEAAGKGSFGPTPAFEIFDPRTGTALPWRSIEVADLSGWHRPASEQSSLPTGSPGGPDAASPSPGAMAGGGGGVAVAVDPELGRLAFASGEQLAGDVEITYHCAFPGELGGGPYSRDHGPAPATPSSLSDFGKGPDARVLSGRAPDSGDGEARFTSLREALEARPSDGTPAVIQLVDNATYGGSRGVALEVLLRAGDSLTITAAPGDTPCFIGDLRVLVGAGPRPSRLILEGLTLGGRIIVSAVGEESRDSDRRCALDVRHCTLAPPDLALGRRPASGEGGIELDSAAAGRLELTVEVRSSILGSVAIPAGAGRLAISDSVIDGRGGPAISGAPASIAPSCPAELARCTVFGRMTAAELTARDTIFADPVAVSASGDARARHCYVPAGSTVARLERCQPTADGPRLGPVFISRRHGQPGYARLAARCPPEIRAGGSNGSEMGAFAGLGNPFREANLAGILEEYLPWGLEPRVFHVT